MITPTRLIKVFSAIRWDKKEEKKAKIRHFEHANIRFFTEYSIF